MNKKFWIILRPFYGSIGVLLGLNFFMSIVKYASTLYLKLLVDSVDTGPTGEEKLVKGTYIIFLIVSLIMAESVRRYKSFYQFNLLPKIKKYIYDMFLDRMLKYKYEYYHKKSSNVLLNSLRNLSEGSEELLISLKDVFWKTCTVSMSILGSGFLIHKTIGMILCLWIVIWVIICVVFVKKSYQYSVKLYSTKNDFVMYLGDIFNNITTVKAFNTSEYEEEESKKNSTQVLGIELENNFLFFKINSLNTFLFFVFLISSFSVLYANKLATPGNFLLLFTNLTEMYFQLDDLNENFCDITDVSGQINDSISQLYREIPKAENREKIFEIGNGDITIRNLICHSPNDQSQRIFGVDGEIYIKGGSTIAVVGTSGAGKSTLFKLLLGLIKPSSGEIIIDGQNIFECSLASARSAFAFIPQDVGLFHRSILENVKYGSFDKKLEEVVSVVDQSKLTGIVNGLRYGYNSVFGKDCNFSGGQKQRMVIARGLLRQAKIFLFDESTSALDAKTEYEILTSISDITKGCTKFIIAHRLKTVKNADLILVFDKGRLVQQGSHAELIQEKGLYSELMDLM
ncbi:ABC transporter ATP-binding protein [Alphaproteobacteria bacterium endosymbiont of Tiliacea citrago]|uniref:ABC transporter ATP-binding protein n=1 Tax=Alphaproteobacteria bacterium endosymbiont of Tiliacea citrago TaxID=3077944 RepID=UPI00313B449E